MKPFSFVHAADLHLDSPFTGLGLNNPDIAAVLRSATFDAFDRCIRLCLENRVDFLLVAGDVYDGADRSLWAQIKFRDGLKRLSEAGIQSFIVHGNHDPLEGWSSSLIWPAGVHIFGGNEVKIIPFEKEGEILASIQGISYRRRDERRNLAKGFERGNSGFQIGLLHCNTGTDTGHEPYAPCSLDDLIRANMDYWALGHVHEKRILSSGAPWVVYAGNTQGRNIKEMGERGCYLARVDENGEVHLEFHGTDVVRWLNRNISLENISAEQALLDTLHAALENMLEEAAGRPVICRIGLSGRSQIYQDLQRPGFIPDLLEILHEQGMTYSPFIWVERVDLQVRPTIDIQARRESQDFIGDLLRFCQELQTDPELREAITQDLSSLYYDRRAHKFLHLPDHQTLQKILEDAEGICLDGLLGESE
jgi:DNA repair exonuclease SbcCD nuclease subunit